jgi:hypothetical protein
LIGSKIHQMDGEITDAYAKGWIIEKHYNLLNERLPNLKNSNVDAKSRSNQK